jgi:hypothetical protein
MTENAAPATDPDADRRNAGHLARRTADAIERLPEPDVIRRYLTDRLAERVGEVRDARREAGDDDGSALGPDEVRGLSLELARMHEGLHGYAQAFEGAAATAAQYLGEEQRAAVAGEDGEPCEALDLLDDDDSTVRIADRVSGAGWVCDDLGPLFEGVAVLTVGEHSEALTAQGIPETAEAGAVIEAVVIAALRRLGEAGKVEPQVTKINGKGKMADQVARVDRKLAGRIRATMRKSAGRVTGTKIERKVPEA